MYWLYWNYCFLVPPILNTNHLVTPSTSLWLSFLLWHNILSTPQRELVSLNRSSYPPNQQNPWISSDDNRSSPVSLGKVAGLPSPLVLPLPHNPPSPHFSLPALFFFPPPKLYPWPLIYILDSVTPIHTKNASQNFSGPPHAETPFPKCQRPNRPWKSLTGTCLMQLKAIKQASVCRKLISEQTAT